MPKRGRSTAGEPEPKAVNTVSKPADSPLVFISHDSRDADLAEAFSKLLKSVSAGMLKSFRSSDKKGGEGIEFGDEWYKALMSKLEVASDVVCLLTERSLDRPWLLYEAGVAKGKLNTPVHGLALGVPLSRVSTGPFYQFQNSDDSDDSLIKLVLQLCRRIASLEPDHEVVRGQVQIFKSSVEGALKALGSKKTEQKSEKTEETTEASVAKVLEEMKFIVRELPARFEQRIFESADRARPRRFPFRQFHPMMLVDMSEMISRRSGDPIGILMIASVFQEDFPWLYELGREAYRAVRSHNAAIARDALRRFQEAVEFTQHGPFAEELAVGSKETRMMLREAPMAIEHFAKMFMARPARRIEKIPGPAVSKE